MSLLIIQITKQPYSMQTLWEIYQLNTKYYLRQHFWSVKPFCCSLVNNIRSIISLHLVEFSYSLETKGKIVILPNIYLLIYVGFFFSSCLTIGFSTGLVI